MPRKALHPCGRPGCGHLTHSRYCPGCTKAVDKHDRRRRGSAAQRGYGRPWAAYTRRYRQLHPWCVKCSSSGEWTPTEEVDHIIPVSGPDDPRFWDPDNHQGLCTPCHSRKTVTEDKRGLNNPPLARARTYDVDKTPKSSAWIA